MNARAAYCRDYYDRYERAIRGNRPLMPARPVAEHIAACIEVGMSRNAIARAAQVAEATIRRVELKPDARVREGVGLRILAVVPTRPVTAQGVIRRLKALGALGWSTSAIAARCGLNVDTVKAWRRGEFTDPSLVADRVVAAYDALSMRAPNPTGRFERSAVTQVRQRAARNGWASPLAWDDDTIDDPDATPDKGARTIGTDLDEWLWIVNAGENPVRAAQRLGVTLHAIERAAYRNNRHDVTAIANVARNAERQAS